MKKNILEKDQVTELFRAFREGDISAAEPIVSALFLRLVFFLDRYVHDGEEAEDIATETFAQVFAMPEKFNFKASFKTYLFTVGKNKAIDFLRKKEREKTDSYAEITEGEMVNATGEVFPSPEEIFLQSETEKAVNKALEKLPEKERAAVHLVYFEDLSYEEAARVLHVSRKKVDNLLYRAKKTLKELLEDER